VESIGYKLVMDEEARKFIANKGYDIQYGARPLKRAIQTHVEDALAEVILASDIQEGDTIRGTYDKEKDAIVMVVEK
jgi:ATP-dependent Clp protease ATP-binding subunit ClpC